MRATLKTAKDSTIPEKLGVCANDTARIAAAVNDAQQRLIFAGREAGWWQGWVKVRFSVTPTAPYITLSQEFARIINMAVGEYPIYIHNEFYEVLPGGVGPMPSSNCSDWCGTVAGYERGIWTTSVDLTATNNGLRVYITDVRDVGSRILVIGLDQNGNEIYSQDGLHTVTGAYITFASPFADLGFIVSKIKAIVKPVTFGDILLYQVDQTTGVEVLLSRYKASETQPAYRRYYISPLPACCTSGSSFTVTAIAKVEYIPAIRDTDPLIIGNIPALTEMVQALRYYSQDVIASHQLGAAHEKRAIKLMRQELEHYMGLENPAVAVDIREGHSFCRIGLSTNI
jgi:hypothetical protein